MPTRAELNALSYKVIGCALKVRRVLGPGLLESAYQSAFVAELRRAGLRVEVERALPVVYEGVRIDCGYRIDVVVNDLLIVEIKAVKEIEEIHVAQTLTYLRLSALPVALLINFNACPLKSGIRRLINERVLPLDADETVDPGKSQNAVRP